VACVAKHHGLQGKTILMYYEAKYKRIAQRFFCYLFFFLTLVAEFFAVEFYYSMLD
jgi:hypothetical protein